MAAPSRTKKRRGIIAVLAAVLMIVVLGMIAFACDFGVILMQRTNVQRAVDAATLAASDVKSSGGTLEDVQNIINFYLDANGIDSSNIATEDLTIEFGNWDSETRQFTTDEFDDSTAIRLAVVQRSNRFYFAPIFGRSSFDTTAEAIAAGTTAAAQDINLTIDCSGSMGNHNRMTYTKAAANVLLDNLGEDSRVGVTVYSWKDPNDGNRKTGHVETELDFDASATEDLIPDLKPKYYTGGTNIAGGMRATLDEFRNNERATGTPTKNMVLLTDGRANKVEPPGTDPWNSIDYYANLAKDENVVIHAITLGDNASQAAMESAADVTGGTYHHIEDGDYSALESLFQQLGQGIGRPHLVH